MDLARLHAEARYDQVLPGVSVRYTLSGNCLKEDILLDDASALGHAAIRLPSEYQYQASPNGEPSVCDLETGEVEFVMGTPMVYDAAGRRTAADVRLTPLDGYTRMTYDIDADWLAAASFPVMIDPVVMTKVEDAAASDAYIWNNTKAGYQSS